MAESQKVTRRTKQKLEEAIQKGLRDLVTNHGIYAVSVGNLVDYLTKRGFDEKGLIIQIKEMAKEKKVLVGKGRIGRAFEVVSVSYLRKIRPYPKTKRTGRSKKDFKAVNVDSRIF